MSVPGLSIRHEGPGGDRRRTRFEKRPDGWHLYEDRWNGCQFVPVGHETVDDVELEVAGDLLAEVQ